MERQSKHFTDSAEGMPSVLALSSPCSAIRTIEMVRMALKGEDSARTIQAELKLPIGSRPVQQILRAVSHLKYNCNIWTRVLYTLKYCPRGNVNHVANVMTTNVIFRICPILRVRRTSLSVPRVQYCSATAHVVVKKYPLYWRRYALRCKKYSHCIT